MTRIEQQILALREKGLDAAQIAAMTKRNVSTVYYHYHKLDIATRKSVEPQPDDTKRRATARCKGCGGMCEQPCVLCGVRQSKGEHSGMSRGPAPHDGQVIRRAIGVV